MHEFEHIQTFMHMHMHTHVFLCVHMPAQENMYTQATCAIVCKCEHVHACECMCACTHTHTHTHTHMHMCVCLHTCMQMFANPHSHGEVGPISIGCCAYNTRGITQSDPKHRSNGLAGLGVSSISMIS